MKFWRIAGAVLCAAVTLLAEALLSSRSDTSDAAEPFSLGRVVRWRESPGAYARAIGCHERGAMG